MKSLLAAVIFLVSFIPSAACGSGDKNTPAFWIERLSSPDAVVMGPAQIAALNTQILSRVDQMADIETMPDAISGGKLRDWLLFDPAPDFAMVKRYTASGAKLSKKNINALSSSINIEAVAAFNPVRFGRVVIRADIRGFPTDAVVLRRPGENSFDTLQYSSIYPPTPVALLHISKDGKWGFFQTPFTRGWIKLDKVAFSSRSGVAASAEPLVITGSSVAVYDDSGLSISRVVLPMGTILDIVSEDAAAWQVRLPARDAGGNELSWTAAYVDKNADAHKGFLPYTQRTIITQAFKMLGERYGWGGLSGRRDCSEFLRNTFATVGVRLPRNSQQQLNSGIVMSSDDGGVVKSAALKAALTGAQALQGMTFLVTSAHIMLYLGTDAEGSPYVIHQAHGYTQNGRKHIVDRVVVSGLGYRNVKAGLWPLLGQVKTVTKVTLLPDNAAADGGVVSIDKAGVNGL